MMTKNQNDNEALQSFFPDAMGVYPRPYTGIAMPKGKKRRVIDNGLGDKITVDCYQAKHYPENQKLFAGVPFDPVLPDGFDNTPNSDREELEIEHWWGRAFIEPVYFYAMLVDETYQQYVDRCSEFSSFAETRLYHHQLRHEERWLVDRARQKRDWYDRYPSGVRFDVRCLDGGAWDRSSWWGSFSNLEDAILCAKTGRSRRK